MFVFSCICICVHYIYVVIPFKSVVTPMQCKPMQQNFIPKCTIVLIVSQQSRKSQSKKSESSGETLCKTLFRFTPMIRVMMNMTKSTLLDWSVLKNH